MYFLKFLLLITMAFALNWTRVRAKTLANTLTNTLANALANTLANTIANTRDSYAHQHQDFRFHGIRGRAYSMFSRVQSIATPVVNA